MPVGIFMMHEYEPFFESKFKASVTFSGSEFKSQPTEKTGATSWSIMWPSVHSSMLSASSQITRQMSCLETLSLKDAGMVVENVDFLMVEIFRFFIDMNDSKSKLPLPVSFHISETVGEFIT